MTDKATLKKVYLAGYSEGRGVESLSDVSIRTAEARFERWYSLNLADENPAEVAEDG